MVQPTVSTTKKGKTLFMDLSTEWIANLNCVYGCVACVHRVAGVLLVIVSLSDSSDSFLDA